MTLNQIGLPNLNKNVKCSIIFDNSLVGVRPTNSFIYDPTSSNRPPSTDITWDVLKTDYVIEDTTIVDDEENINIYQHINSFILLDTNINNYNNILLDNDSTVIIENEDYYIIRQNVPPPRYIYTNDSFIYDDMVYNSVVNFRNYNGLRHVKINQHNHSCSKHNNDISKYATMDNNTMNEFLVEFSGYSEVVEL